MKKEIKEKIIEILRSQDNCYEMLGFDIGEKKVADQILALFEAREKEILEKIKLKKKFPCMGWGHLPGEAGVGCKQCFKIDGYNQAIEDLEQKLKDLT